MKRKPIEVLQKGPTSQINSTISQETNDKLERLKHETHLSKSLLVSRCIQYALPIFEQNPEKLIKAI